MQSRQESEYAYMNEKDDVMFRCKPPPPDTQLSNSRKLQIATITQNNEGNFKKKDKFRVIISVVVAFFFIVMLALFGVQAYWAFGNNNQDIALKEKMERAMRTSEKNHLDMIQALMRNDSKLADIVDRQSRVIASLQTEQERKKVDCSKIDRHAFKSGNESRGVFEIYVSRQKVDVYCDQSLGAVGWTVFHRRMDGTVDFFRNHSEYVNGFGSPTGEHWIGLNRLHKILRTAEKFQLRVDMEDWDGVKKFAEYSRFDVDSAPNDYTLSVSGYSGTAGDSLAYHNGMKFSTKDHDVDGNPTRNCADYYNGAWWYKSCHYSNLNGIFHKYPYSPDGDGIVWRGWRGSKYSLKFVEMKIRPTY